MTSRALAVGVLVLMSGCQETVQSGGFGERPLPPDPRPASDIPVGARPDALVMNMSPTALDTNGNGYPDQMHATVHMFDRRFAPPMHAEGTVIFRLFAGGESSRADARPLREWTITGEALARTRSRSQFGACYQFRLSLLDQGRSDEFPHGYGDILAVFEPADGGPEVRSGETSTVQLGRRGDMTTSARRLDADE